MEDQVNPLQYFPSGEVKDPEPELGYTIEITLNEGLNDGSLIHAGIQPLAEDFIELPSFRYRGLLCLRNFDNSKPTAEEMKDTDVWLDPQGLHACFATAEARFNDKSVSTMSNYAYSTALSRNLGMAKEVREGAWAVMDGTYPLVNIKKSSVEGIDMSRHPIFLEQSIRLTPEGIELEGRIWIDVFTSARQLLPPGVKVDVYLRRAFDHLTIMSNNPTAARKFKAYLQWLKISCRCKKMSDAVKLAAMRSAPGGLGITYISLDDRIHTITNRSHVYSWLNALDNAALPNRVYVAFIATKSQSGYIGQIATYFEQANLRRLQFRLNGRNVFTQPLRVKFETDPRTGEVDVGKSDARDGYLTVLEVLQQTTDPTTPLRIDYNSYMLGHTTYILEFGKVGYKSGAQGSLDVLCDFGDGGTPFKVGMILWTEQTKTVKL